LKFADYSQAERGTQSNVSILLSIAGLWLLATVAWVAFFWLLSRRPLSETDRWCGQMDHALRSRYGSGPGLIR
jgi:hypothetical protein